MESMLGEKAVFFPALGHELIAKRDRESGMQVSAGAGVKCAAQFQSSANRSSDKAEQHDKKINFHGGK